MNIEPDDYAEIVRRLVSLRDVSAALATVFDDEASRQGAEEMKTSLERVLQLLGHPQ